MEQKGKRKAQQKYAIKDHKNKCYEYLTTSSQSEIMVPNVIDITGPISGDTSIAATMLLAAKITIKFLCCSSSKWKFHQMREKSFLLGRLGRVREALGRVGEGWELLQMLRQIFDAFVT